MGWSLIKVKVVSLQFKIKAVEGNLCFQLISDYEGSVPLIGKASHGLLQNMISLCCHTEDASSLRLMITEESGEQVGRVKLDRSMFDSLRVHKLPIGNCFDKAAHIETYLQLLPSRPPISKSMASQPPLVNSISNNQPQSQEKQEQQPSSSHQRSEQSSQETQITFIQRSQFQKQQLSSHQSDRIENLQALNHILMDTNKQLEQENAELRAQLERQTAKQTEFQQTVSQLKQQIQSAFEEQRLKRVEVNLKNNQVSRLAKELRRVKGENEKLHRDLSELRGSLTSQIKEESETNSLLSQLSRYTATAKKEVKRVHWIDNGLPPTQALIFDLGKRGEEVMGQQTRRFSRTKITHNDTQDSIKEQSTMIK